MNKKDYTRRYIGIAEEYLRKVDGAVGETLAKLRRKGKELPCRPSCSWCCRLPLYATLPEAMLATRHIREDLGKKAISGLIEKIASWLLWEENELPRLVKRGTGIIEAHTLHGPGCPMLSGGLCVIYPVRPMGCRVHFSYDINLCMPSEKPAALFDCHVEVAEILDAAGPLCMEYRRRLEADGIDFESCVKPLPELVLAELQNI